MTLPYGSAIGASTGVAAPMLRWFRRLRLAYRIWPKAVRRRGLTQWPPDHPPLKRFKARRCSTRLDVRARVKKEHGQLHTHTDTNDGPNGAASVSVRESPCRSVKVRAGSVLSSEAVANAALSLLNPCGHFRTARLPRRPGKFQGKVSGTLDFWGHHRMALT